MAVKPKILFAWDVHGTTVCDYIDPVIVGLNSTFEHFNVDIKVSAYDISRAGDLSVGGYLHHFLAGADDFDVDGNIKKMVEYFHSVVDCTGMKPMPYARIALRTIEKRGYRSAALSALRTGKNLSRCISLCGLNDYLPQHVLRGMDVTQEVANVSPEKFKAETLLRFRKNGLRRQRSSGLTRQKDVWKPDIIVMTGNTSVDTKGALLGGAIGFRYNPSGKKIEDEHVPRDRIIDDLRKVLPIVERLVLTP